MSVLIGLSLSFCQIFSKVKINIIDIPGASLGWGQWVQIFSDNYISAENFEENDTLGKNLNSQI